VPSNETSWRESIIRLGRAFEVPDLRNRILFVMAMFAVYVAGLHIPAPLVNPERLPDMGAISGLLDIMSGGGFKKLSVLALGIIPYINASIIMQLLGIAVPAVQRMQKEGDTGRKILSSYTRWGTVILAFLQSVGLCVFLKSAGAIDNIFGWYGTIPIVVAMVAGTSFLMWVGEQLTDKGIGNGVSLIIFAGIMIRLPATFGQIFNLAKINAGQDNMLQLILDVGLIFVIFVAIVVFITYVHQAIRKIPIQHAKRVVGSRVFSSSNTYLPLKVVTAGVIPIIFAISVVMLPGTIAQFFEKTYADQSLVPLWIKIMKMLSPGQHWLGGLIYFGLVVFFTYFYTAVVYNVQDIADNLKKHGSFIPGIRPGKNTETYVDKVLTRITFAGALFLGLVALLPYIIPVILRSSGAEASFFPLWGGTSLLIVVGVALDTMKQIEANLVMHHYDGFIKN